MRSLMFVPADRPERIGTALASGADAVIVDLEDAVAPARKAGARAGLAAHLPTQGHVLLRINAPGTEWFDDDLALVRRLPSLRGVVLPKAEREADVETVAAHALVWPLIETAAGLKQATALGAVTGVQRLVFGSIDFQLDLGIRDPGAGLAFFRSQLVWTSRLAGLPAPIDGACTALEDETRLVEEAQQARGMGFGGKLCLHPRQVAPIHRVFNPSVEEQAWARRVLAAASEAQGAAVRLDGQMIDRPVVLRAEAILNESKT